MDFNDSGLTIYQRRLLDCANTTRYGTGKFDMSEWHEETPCGTVCCAVGDYILQRKPEGLWLRHAYVLWSIPVSSSGKEGGAAVEEHFGLPREEALHLFSSLRYPPDKLTDRAYVADRIEQFVMEKVKA